MTVVYIYILHVPSRLLWVFEYNPIVSRRNKTVVQFHMAASCDIDSIRIGHMAVIVDYEILHQNIITAKQVQGPVHGILENNIFNPYIPAAIEPYHIIRS